MKKLLAGLRLLKRHRIQTVIESRMKEFAKPRDNEEIFGELCFCILTANYSAEGGIRIQKAIGRGFCTLPEGRLAGKLKELGHRFPNARAGYVHEARKHISNMKSTLRSHEDDKKLREWVVKNVKGLGYKEASHFLRNIGYKNLAIIDFHIVDLLVAHGLIEEPKTITPKKYLQIEAVLEDIGRRAGLCQAELDLYLWYMETGKVLK